MKYSLPKKYEAFFSEISEKLWANNASIMVGAGFSKNAINKSGAKPFPTWFDLGDVLCDKLKNSSPEKYLNLLKLADEVESSFGRPTLNGILKENMPDLEYTPGKLHQDLLNLPWRDVFTTNYDTLLERAAESIIKRSYDIVVNREGLVYSRQPRIVKLHGSFPSIEPFIITEEDYRKYPHEFAPFVNTVQQALVETVFCLIGFSGDDPNFLKWIGWVRDNFGGVNSPKIYLILITSLNEGQRLLLTRRNIIPIELFSECNGKILPSDALEAFLNRLEQGEAKSKRIWPNSQVPNIRDKKSVMETLESWRNTRLEFPNWLITPEKKRRKLKIYTISASLLLQSINEIDDGSRFEFLYEYIQEIQKDILPGFKLQPPAGTMSMMMMESRYIQ